VAKIFNIMKDDKLERKRNFNESYLKRKSFIHHIVHEEATKKKTMALGKARRSSD
jgi:hypothetical protein